MSYTNYPIGQRIEDYEIFEQLGKGGFGFVYRAKCKHSGRDVALKMIDKAKMQSQGMVGRVKQEVAIHSKLRHSSILQLYTFFEDDKYVYLVLELAQNGELYRYIKEKQRVLTEAQTANILSQVVNGLLYLKTNNIVHRDMSLSNLLLTTDFKVKIADFGLATIARPNERHTTLCGTPNYISPEVATGATHGLPVDVWALGCMMYTLLVGKPPFDTDDVKATLTRAAMVDFTVPTHLSFDAKDLLMRLLKKNPEERIHIDDVQTHPFLLKHMSATSQHTYSNTMASADSGLLTWSSGTTSAQNITGKMARSDDQGYYQIRANSNSNYVFNNNINHNNNHHMRAGHSESSLYHRFDSQYNGYASQPAQLQSNELVDRIANMDLMQTPIDKQFFGSGGGGGGGGSGSGSAGYGHYSSKPIYGNSYNFSEAILNHTPMPLQENQIYGMQPNLAVQNQNLAPNFAPARTKPQPMKAKAKQKLSVPPLNTERLLPIKFKAKKVIMSILATGEVVVELIKNKDNEDRVYDVCRISKDGLRIVVYQPNAGRGMKIQDSPPDLPESGADLISSYENLPSKHIKKYELASQFIQMVRAKTPKVTYYSEKGRCDLMENLDNFELELYDGGKIVRTTEDNVTFSKDRKTFAMSSGNEHWLHYQQCFEHCKTLERTLNTIQSQCDVFPVTVGRSRKTTAASALGISKLGSTLTSINSEMASVARISQTKASPVYRPMIGNPVEVPGIGYASQLPDGYEVTYLDGTYFKLHKCGDMTYREKNGNEHFYQQGSSEPPEIVRVRAQEMPFVASHFVQNNSPPMPVCTPINNRCMQPPIKLFR